MGESKRRLKTASELQGTCPNLTRWQIQALVDQRRLLLSRQASCTNKLQAEVFAMGAAAIELGLLEKCGVRLLDGPTDSAWERMDDH